MFPSAGFAPALRDVVLLRRTIPTMSSPTTRHRGGMTLLEVMLAVFVLVMVFGAALSSLLQVSATVATAKNRTRAVALLNQQMEEMRAMSFTRLQTRLADTAFTAGTITASTLTGTGARAFRWSRTVDTAAADASSSLVKVVVTVTWEQVNGVRSVSAYSYFGRDGVLTAESAAS